MSLWKADDGTIHDDMDGNALDLPGWPTGLRKLTDEEVADLRAPRPLTQEETREVFYAAVYGYCDELARQKGFMDANTCVSFVGDEDAAVNAKATAFKVWRSAAIKYAFVQSELVYLKQRTQPTPEELVSEIRANVPMVWPS